MKFKRSLDPFFLLHPAWGKVGVVIHIQMVHTASHKPPNHKKINLARELLSTRRKFISLETIKLKLKHNDFLKASTGWGHLPYILSHWTAGHCHSSISIHICTKISAFTIYMESAAMFVALMRCRCELHQIWRLKIRFVPNRRIPFKKNHSYELGNNKSILKLL